MADARTIDAIHARMLVRYGSKWINMWNGVDPELVKTDWARELERVTRDQVMFALENLPAEFPPTAGQFRSLCLELKTSSEYQQWQALPAPAANPQRVKAELERMQAIKGGLSQPREWAYAMQEREKRGEALTEAQRAAWRAAIDTAPSEALIGEFRPIPRDLYPPGMRNMEGGL
jgi:hypothetical protein